jgi:hypothetical protein
MEDTMGFLDRLFGRDDDANRRAPQVPQIPAAERPSASAYRTADGRYLPPAPDQGVTGQGPAVRSEDEAAIERYRYLLRTAPPETIERVHAEAFSKLTESQRQQVLADLSSTLPAAERPTSDDPHAMARAATRAEYTQPGYMERTFGNRSFAGQGGGFGSMLGASMLGTIGGYFIGSALVSSFLLPSMAYGDGGESGVDESGDAGAEGETEVGGEGESDFGGEAAGGDFGGFDDFGGDDFGGGDFGGF